MNLSVVVYFLLFAFVLGWLFFKVDGQLKAKVIMIAAMFYVSSAIIFSFDSYMGWPTRDSDAPDTMVLTNVLIFDKTNKSEGYIYVTGIPCSGQKNIDDCMETKKSQTTLGFLSPWRIFGYEPEVVNTPRMYTFPYTDENRKLFAEAKQNIDGGGRSVFKRKGKGQAKDGKGGSGDDDGSPTGEGGGQGGEGTKDADSEGEMEIYVDNQAITDIIRKDAP